MDQSVPLDTEIRNEASMIIERARQHRELVSDSHPLPGLSSPDVDEITPSSSTRLIRPMSPSRTGQTQARVRLSTDDEADYDDSSEDFDAAFDAEFEKVKDAYTRGIRPCNNAFAPQQHSVPVYGLEDATPPEWPQDDSPTIVTAPRRDRMLPRDPHELAHRLGLNGLTRDLGTDAAGFVTNVRVRVGVLLDRYVS